MSAESLDQFLSQLAEPFTAEVLFDAIDDVVFFMKNRYGHYLVVNQTLVHRCGLVGKQELLGKTAAELFPGQLGKNYLDQDQQLIESGRSLLNELELHLYPTRDAGWCVTTKHALKDAAGHCIGLVGISCDLHAPSDDYRDIAEALRGAQRRLDAPATLDEIASWTTLSPFQFDRRVRDVFHLSTAQLLLKFRLDLARERLRDTQRPVARIALECGYANQSSFTRQFRQTIGLTPAGYRRRSQKSTQAEANRSHGQSRCNESPAGE